MEKFTTIRDISSDHHLVIAKVKIKLAKGIKVEQKRIKNRFPILKDGQDLDIENEWEAGRYIIKEACEEVLRRKTNKKKDWMSHGTGIKKDKREYVNDLATEAEFAAYKGDIKTLYDITKTLSRRKTTKSKPVKDKDAKSITSLNHQMEKWNEYYIYVLNRPKPDQPVRVEPWEDLSIKTDNIKKYEVKKAIKSLKNGKSAGIDGIPPGAFKSGGNEIIEHMHKFLNKTWDEEKIPTEWIKGFLVKLPTKGDLGLYVALIPSALFI
ncbi:unnamed protein product [Mytilus coruscus]|uniref:Reverse transcriptase domain-containing protein n=1 Tax=Mytilus coruscus TaxID=42192 RepID=A0A6J8AFU9_MYTCO|nr:unnamed protein product [Mytilus coruscus]